MHAFQNFLISFSLVNLWNGSEFLLRWLIGVVKVAITGKLLVDKVINDES